MNAYIYIYIYIYIYMKYCMLLNSCDCCKGVELTVSIWSVEYRKGVVLIRSRYNGNSIKINNLSDIKIWKLPNDWGSTEMYFLIKCKPSMLTCGITYILFFISLKINVNLSLHFEVVVGGDGVQIWMILVILLKIQLWAARQCGCC